jgi:hypothetical protein
VCVRVRVCVSLCAHVKIMSIEVGFQSACVCVGVGVCVCVCVCE